MDPKEEKAPAPSSEPAKPGGVEQLKAPKMEKAPAPSSNPYRWENLSWEQKEVSINRVLLAKANYDKLLAEVPEYKLRTPSILSDSLGSTRKSPLFSSMDKEYPQLLPQIHVMPRRRDTSSVTVRATYKDDTVQFQLPLTSGIVDLKDILKAASKRLFSASRVQAVSTMAADEEVVGTVRGQVANLALRNDRVMFYSSRWSWFCEYQTIKAMDSKEHPKDVDKGY